MDKGGDYSRTITRSESKSGRSFISVKALEGLASIIVVVGIYQHPCVVFRNANEVTALESKQVRHIVHEKCVM